MTLQCTSTADAITSVLLAGDAVLNLSFRPLNASAGTLYVTESGNRLEISETCQSVDWSPQLAPSLATLISEDITRLVVVADESCPAADQILQALSQQQIPHCHCILAADCDAKAFMDEEDSEAVAERLRQLGYI